MQEGVDNNQLPYQDTPDDDAGGFIAPEVMEWQKRQPTEIKVDGRPKPQEAAQAEGKSDTQRELRKKGYIDPDKALPPVIRP